MSFETTFEQQAAVARDECRMHGHDFDVIAVFGSLDPQTLICSRCGSTWRVSPGFNALDTGGTG